MNASPNSLPVLESCDGCGACCFTVTAPPFRIDHLVNEVIERQVPAELVDEVMSAWEVRLLVETPPCLWFDHQTLRCQHYDFRPTACREFELNSPSCHAVRAAKLNNC